MDFLVMDLASINGFESGVKKRWLQSLEEDLRIMRVGRRWEKVRCREELGSVVREAKAHPGL
jgi:hypothetical protein